MVGLGLIFTADRSTFSNRGRIWIGLREALGPFSVAGNGVTGWTDIQRAIGTSHFPHSEFGLIYVYGGWIGLILFSTLIFLAARRQRATTRHGAFYSTMPLVVLMTICFTEAIWNPGVVDTMTWLMVAVALSFTAHHGSEPDVAPAAVGERRPLVLGRSTA